MRFLPAFISLLVMAAAPVAGAGSLPLPMEGTWVSAQARQALESGEQREVGCFLIISSGPIDIREVCDGVERVWRNPSLFPLGPSAAEIRSREDGVERKVVARAGAPDELEVTTAGASPGEFRRLYRLNPKRLLALESLSLAQSRLVGTWQIAEGGRLSFESDGSYAFEGEVGRYRIESGFQSEGGAWGVLFLRPEQGVERRYLLHGAGWRIGLAEVPRDLELHLPSAVRDDDDPEDGGEEVFEEAPARGDRERDVVIDGVAIPLPAGPPAWRIVSGSEEEPVVTLWLSREEKEREEVAEGQGDIGQEEAQEGHVPIAQPISPKRRACGCGAGEGGVALLGALPLFWWRRSLRR